MNRPLPSLGRFLLGTLAAAALALASLPGHAQAPRTGAAVLAVGTDDTLLQAREALRRKDQTALASAAASLQRTRHPLAQWADTDPSATYATVNSSSRSGRSQLHRGPRWWPQS